MVKLISTSLPSTRPATAARAKPAPIDAATSPTVGALSNDFNVPSGNRMDGMFQDPKTKKCGEPHFSTGYSCRNRGFRTYTREISYKFENSSVSFGKLVGAIGLEPTTPTMSR